MTTYANIRNTNNTTPFGGEQDVHRVAQMLRRATPIICADRFGMAYQVPAKSTDTARFRRVKNIIDPTKIGKSDATGFEVFDATKITTEGSKNSAFSMQYDAIDVTLSQYGIWTTITDKSADMNQNDVINDAIDVCGDTMAEIKEMVTWAAINATGSVRFAGGVASKDLVSTKIALSDIRYATRFLMRNKAKMITSVLDGSIKVGTKPVEAAYVALGHTDLLPDLRGLGDAFTPVAEYGSMKPTCPQEVGAIENVRFVLSPYFSPGAANSPTSFLGQAAAGTATTYLNDFGGGTIADIYSLVVMGADAFGTVVLRGMNAAKILTRMPNTPAYGDELGQNGSVGAKTHFASKILNDQWIISIRVLASKNPS